MNTSTLFGRFANEHVFELAKLLDEINPPKPIESPSKPEPISKPMVPIRLSQPSIFERIRNYFAPTQTVVLTTPIPLPVKKIPVLEEEPLSIIQLINTSPKVDARTELLSHLMDERVRRSKRKNKCGCIAKCIGRVLSRIGLIKKTIKPQPVRRVDDLSLDEIILKIDLYIRLETLIGHDRMILRNVPQRLNDLALQRFFYRPTTCSVKASTDDINVFHCIRTLNRHPEVRESFNNFTKEISSMDDLKSTLLFNVFCPIFIKDFLKGRIATLPSGILFYGPQVCAKAHIAKQLANAIKAEIVNYFPDKDDSSHGNMVSINIHNIFKNAAARFEKEGKRTVIFIDEATRVLPNRLKISQRMIENVNQFLIDMEDCHEKGILVICATNFKDQLDPAAIRVGRIDLELRIELDANETQQRNIGIL